MVTLFEVHAENADEETTCMAACSIRNIISERLGPELTGSDNKETLYNIFLKLIDECITFFDSLRSTFFF